MQEVWKDVTGYDNIKKNLYEVSNFGRIRNKETKYILKKRLNKDGYEIINLQGNLQGKTKGTYLVHRLVAFAFIPNDDYINKFQVNHKDEIKNNNCADNLEWCTNEYNWNYNNNSALKRAIINSRKSIEAKRINGILYTKRSHKIKMINPETNEVVNIFETLTDASNKTGIRPSSINNVLNTNKIFHDFKWEKVG